MTYLNGVYVIEAINIHKEQELDEYLNRLALDGYPMPESDEDFNEVAHTCLTCMLERFEISN